MFISNFYIQTYIIYLYLDSEVERFILLTLVIEFLVFKDKTN